MQRMSVHDGPGLRTTVFFKGCPLRCLWCGNPESQGLQPQAMFFKELCVGCGHCREVCPSGAVAVQEQSISRDFARCTGCGRCAAECPTGAAALTGRAYTVEEVMSVIRKDAAFYQRSGGGVTFSGGECTMQEGFLRQLMDACLAEGLHICLDTCGQTSRGLFEELMGKADLFLFDIKHMDNERHKALTGVGNGAILRNLRRLLERYPEKVRIRMPLIPALNDAQENIASMAAFLKPYGIKHVDVLPCHAFGRNKYAALMRSVPSVSHYAPEQLHAVLERFQDAGLDVEVV